MSTPIDREENLIAYIKGCFEKTLNDVITHFVCTIDELQPANISSLLECLYDTEDFRTFSDDVDSQYVSFVREMFEKIWGGILNGNLTQEQVSLIDACFHEQSIDNDITCQAYLHWKECKEHYANSDNDNT